MAALAFFYFAFLGVEYLFDEKVALLAGAGSVAMAESVVVGISVAGFLLYPPAPQSRRPWRPRPPATSLRPAPCPSLRPSLPP